MCVWCSFPLMINLWNALILFLVSHSCTVWLHHSSALSLGYRQQEGQNKRVTQEAFYETYLQQKRVWIYCACLKLSLSGFLFDI